MIDWLIDHPDHLPDRFRTLDRAWSSWSDRQWEPTFNPHIVALDDQCVDPRISACSRKRWMTAPKAVVHALRVAKTWRLVRRMTRESVRLSAAPCRALVSWPPDFTLHPIASSPGHCSLLCKSMRCQRRQSWLLAAQVSEQGSCFLFRCITRDSPFFFTTLVKIAHFYPVGKKERLGNKTRPRYILTTLRLYTMLHYTLNFTLFTMKW